MKSKIISFILALVLCVSSVAVVFAAENSYSVISPQPSSSTGIIYCDNLLISVKVAQNTALRFTLYTYPNCTAFSSINAVPASSLTVKTQVGTPNSFVSDNNISFYTKQVNEISAGLYSLKVDTLDSSGSAVSSYNKYFIVKGNASKDTSTIYETQPSNKVLFFQSVFKNLFGTAVIDLNENEYQLEDETQIVDDSQMVDETQIIDEYQVIDEY